MSVRQQTYLFVFLAVIIVIMFFLVAAGGSKVRLIEKTSIFLASEAETAIEKADTCYQIEGVFGCECGKGFITNEAGEITYSGAGGTFLILSTANFKASKVCEVIPTLFINGTDTGRSIKVTFNNANSYSDVGLTGSLVLKRGDIIRMKVKSDKGSTDIQINSLRIIFWGE